MMNDRLPGILISKVQEHFAPRTRQWIVRQSLPGGSVQHVQSISPFHKTEILNQGASGNMAWARTPAAPLF